MHARFDGAKTPARATTAAVLNDTAVADLSSGFLSPSPPGFR